MVDFNPKIAATDAAVVSTEVKTSKVETSDVQTVPMVDGEGQDDGKGTKTQHEKEINPYANDIANFSKFGRADANDAMNLTGTATSNIRKQLMVLEHNFPGIQVELPPAPDPTKCGKRVRGYDTYKERLKNWESECSLAIQLAQQDAQRNMFSSPMTQNPFADIDKKDEIKNADKAIPQGESTNEPTTNEGTVIKDNRKSHKKSPHIPKEKPYEDEYGGDPETTTEPQTQSRVKPDGKKCEVKDWFQDEN